MERRAAEIVPGEAVRAIRGCLERHNEQPTPFRWTRPADEIIESANSIFQLINPTTH